MLRVDVRAQVSSTARRTSLAATGAAGRLSRGYSDYAENATCAGPAKGIAATYFVCCAAAATAARLSDRAQPDRLGSARLVSARPIPRQLTTCACCILWRGVAWATEHLCLCRCISTLGEPNPLSEQNATVYGIGAQLHCTAFNRRAATP
jgi:hypothetical protein